ncbi:MAG: helix-hairpin-helix domain-containing protein [bacterium]|nr:helix-hairpin-helix domain-containing protein [bacterium]
MPYSPWVRDILYIVVALLICGLAWVREVRQPRPDSLEPLLHSSELNAAQKIVLGKGLSPNSAPARDLELLPGIGPKTAKKIVHWRETRGFFDSPADLLAVPGIGPKTLAVLEPYLDWEPLRQ